MNKDLVTDSELISMLYEDEENVKNIIYERYGYIIDILIKKYRSFINMFNVDLEEIKCEAALGFSDGINSYNEEKNSQLKTFLTICVERRILNFLAKHSTRKAKFMSDTLSLDYKKSDSDSTLADLISDDSKFDPLNNLSDVEYFEEVTELAKNNLSTNEYEVFTYLINNLSYTEIANKLDKSPKQVDNTIQRIKAKMAKVLKENNLK